MQSVSKSINALHDCVRAHVPSNAISTPSAYITSDPKKHAQYVATTFRLLSRTASEHCHAQRNVVFSVNSSGMGDRFRALVSTFYLALLTHTGFSVDWSQPISIDDYFVVQNFSSNFGMVTPVYDVSNSELNASYWAAWIKPNTTVKLISNAYRWAQIARSPMLHQQASLYGLDGLTQPELFRLAMDVMLPGTKPLLLQAAHDALASTGMNSARFLEAGNKSGHYMVGVHMRTGNFDESGHREGAPRVTLQMATCFADRAIAICQEVAACVVVLCSDSKQARDLFRLRISHSSGHTNIQVVSVPGKPTHTVISNQHRLSHGNSTLEWRKTMTDWYLLTRSDALLLSDSGFGWSAAFAGGVKRIWQVNKDERCIWTSGSTDTCSQDKNHHASHRQCSAFPSAMS